MTHSPFHICEDFISPLQCENIAKQLALSVPNYTEKGEPLKYERFVPADLSSRLIGAFHGISTELADRYGAEIVGDPTLMFQQYWENPKTPAEGLHCENSVYKRKKWEKVKDTDLVGFLWLKSFHDSVPLDPRHEVYGGKLEFPAYNFSLTPQRGTLVVYPATPHFVTALSHVMVGSLEQIKFSIKLQDWQYDPKNFPGTYQEWFY